MGVLFQVLVLPIALHLNSLQGDILELQDTPCVGWEGFQAASKHFCDAGSLKRISDELLHRDAIEEFLQSWSPGLQIESTARALVSELLFIYDAALQKALDRGCAWGHGFALLLSMLRVHLLLLFAGFIQDLCFSVLFCLRRSTQRLLAPLSEVLRLAAVAQRERPVASRKKLSAAPISLNSAAIRRRTRAALESLATDAQGLAKVGLEPEDLSFHAAELNHIQERCHPMLEREGDWWLTEEASLEVERGLRASDLLRLLAVLLPLPTTVLLHEEPLAGAASGAVGLLCAASVGLLSGGDVAWPQRLLSVLHVLLMLLGSFSLRLDSVVLSAALLASVELRPLTSRRFRGRARLAASFLSAHLAAQSYQSLRSDFDLKSLHMLGWPCGLLAVLALRRSLLLSGALISSALLMQTARAGPVAAMWWLAACEGWQVRAPLRLDEKPVWVAEVKKSSRISSRQRSSSVPRNGGA